VHPLSEVLIRAETRGIRVDIPKVKQLESELIKIKDELTTQFHDKYGYVNYRSTPDVERFLIGNLGVKPLQKTEKGNVQINKEVLKLYADMGVTAAGDILELKKVDKVINTYIRNYILKNVNSDGIIYVNYNVTGTTSGRLSSSAADDADSAFNAQNLINNIKLSNGKLISIRGCFIPRKGYKFVHSDAAQSELRILGWYSQDSKLVYAATNDEDLHCVNTSAIFGIPYEAVLQLYKANDFDIFNKRKLAKNVGFAIVYDAEWKKIHTMLGGALTEAECKQLVEHDYFARIPNVLIWKKLMWHLAVQNNNTFFTCFGRRRQLPDLLNEEAARKLEIISEPVKRLGIFASKEAKAAYRRLQQHKAALREGINFIIQSTSFDYSAYGMIEICNSKELDQSRFDILLQTHDSTDSEVEEGYVEEFKVISKQLLEKPKLPVDIKMRFDTEITDCLH
jgi:DNA polymerase I-like protein with 3'-5' exonuclease and polymerase domains